VIDLGAQARRPVRKRAAAPPLLAMHSAASADWGTPMLLRRFAAHVLRPAALGSSAIDLDYATGAYWQAWWPDDTRPSAYLDGSPGKDVLVSEDRDAVCPDRGSGFLNAPGLGGGEMVQRCWELFEEDHREKKLGSGFWDGFSLEQFASLQGIGGRNPLTVGVDDLITTLVPSRRARYLLHPEQFLEILRKRQVKLDKRSTQWRAAKRKMDLLRNRTDEAPIASSAPSHASYVTILWSGVRATRREQMARTRQFLAEQRGDPKSLLHRFEAIGPLDMGGRK
jgi:hypothetical protein